MAQGNNSTTTARETKKVWLFFFFFQLLYFQREKKNAKEVSLELLSWEDSGFPRRVHGFSSH